MGHHCRQVQCVDFTPALAVTLAKENQSEVDAHQDTLVDRSQKVMREESNLSISA